MSKQTILAEYEDFLVTKKRHPRRTVACYMTDLGTFRRFVDSRHGLASSWRDVTLGDVQAYLGGQLEAGKPRRSINHSITSVRLFFDYLILLGKRNDNPFRQVDHLKVVPDAPDVLCAEEVGRLVGAPMREYETYRQKMAGVDPKQFGGFIFVRDQLILELLYYTGAKVGELCGLRSAALDAETSSATISGGKGRSIPVPECVIVTWTAYRKLRDERWPNSVRDAGQPLLRNDQGDPITARSVQRIVQRYAIKAGVHPDVTPTALRDTFAWRLRCNGASDETLQYLLGFEDLSSTQYYLSRFGGLKLAREGESPAAPARGPVPPD